MRLGLPYPSSPFPKGSTDAILVWGGSTSVGHHAIQLAKLSGLKVYTYVCHFFRLSFPSLDPLS
jgi:NADPH:quinone reductase-like Zn-dependent oxidoreductase